MPLPPEAQSGPASDPTARDLAIQPLLPLQFVPQKLVAHGLREAHTHPRVGHRLETGDFRTWRMPAEQAWRKDDPFQSIEWPRTGTSFAALVLDCDSRESVERAHACAMSGGLLPTPNLTIIRRGSGRLHAAWCLARPVLRGSNARPKPLRSYARISEYYRGALGADRGYVGVLSHNPLNSDYETCWLRRDPYSLRELATRIPPRWRRPPKPTTPAGRNSTLFDALMREAGSDEMHDDEIRSYGRHLNTLYEIPLDDDEVDGILKSVLTHYRAQWRARGWHTEAFRARQRKRGLASGVARRQRVMVRNARIIERLARGESTRQVAAAEGISQARVVQIRRWAWGDKRTNTVDRGSARQEAGPHY